MSLLDDLIKMKTNAGKDDLLQMIDEVEIYKKLSANEQFKDLKTSEITRTKCPLLAAYADGERYESILADLVGNVYLQIEGYTPSILNNAVERTPKQQKQFEILQSGLVRVEYCDLLEYDHETMKDCVIAVFTKRETSTIAIAAIIIRNSDGYKMYHGMYDKSEENNETTIPGQSLRINRKSGTFTMYTYSILGNNGYRFGTYRNGKGVYDVMIDPDWNLILMAENWVVASARISRASVNQLNIAKKDPYEFAKTVAEIIEREVLL